MEEIFDQMNNEVDKQCAEIEKKNLLIENENLIVNCLSTQLLYDVEKSRFLDLEADMSEVHDESKLISKLEREYLNLQLKYQHLQEKSRTSDIRHLKDLVTSVNDKSREPYNAVDVTDLIEQNDCDRVELEKVKQHYKELYDSIKITRAHTSEKTSTMLNEIESLKAQLRSKEPCFTSDYVKPKVLAPGIVETVREIVEEARVGVNESTEASESKPRSNTRKIGSCLLRRRIRRKVENCVIQWRTHRKVNSPKENLNVVLNGDPQEKKFALGEICQVVQVMLWYLDSGCSKHMTGNRSKLMNFVEKFIGSVRFRNDHLGAIMGYGDYVMGDRVILSCPFNDDLSKPHVSMGYSCSHCCYTQNRSLIHTRHNKTPYELVHDKKPDLTFFGVFGALCYPANDIKDLGKFQAKADIGIFVGSGPDPIMMTPGQLNSGLALSPVPATTYSPPTYKDLEMLFQPMFDEYFDQSTDGEPVPTATIVNVPIVSTNTSVSTTIAQDAPSTSHSLSSSSLSSSSAQSTSGDVSFAEPNQVTQPPDHLRIWTKYHPLDNIVGNPSHPVSIRK
ncbi:retrovirus-related pol polyprotein from transposon TNT 1-94 [Tanacetum coccineum]